MNEPRLNIPELTVSELSTQLKRTLEDAYGYVRVRGELGKVSYHSNGHVYLDLKDDLACIAGVIWRTTAARIKLKLEAGLEVVVTGRITTYPGRSQYQLIVETLEPAGLGALIATRRRAAVVPVMAIALPIPRDEPVITATLPVRSNSSGSPVRAWVSVATDMRSLP